MAASSNRRSLSRRSVLRGAGVSLALPLLDCMSPVYGAEAVPPKRMVFLCTTLGLHGPSLYPKTTGKDYETTDYLELLREHREDFTLFSGLSHPDQGGEHQCEMTWLSAARNPHLDGFRNTVSVDQYAASQLGHVTRFPSISLSSDGPKSQSYTRSGVMVPAESSPSKMFSRLFLDGGEKARDRQKQRLREGRSILDELSRQSRNLQKQSSKSDRRRLEEYFDSVRAAEKELEAAGQWLDRPKPTVDASMPKDIHDKSDLIGRAKLLTSLVPLIVQTDSSRVISIVIQDHHVVPAIDGVSIEHHHLSHHGRDATKIEQLKKIERSIIACYADLLASLKLKAESGSPLLDHTTVLFGSNLGNANAHDPTNLPIFLAGGNYRHGQYVAYDQERNPPLCNLFLRMLQEHSIEAEHFSTSQGMLDW